LERRDRSLTKIYLDSKKLSDNGVARLVNALLRFESNQVELLNLSANYIGVKGSQKLASLLSTKNSALKELDISNNNLGDEGAKEIANALGCNTTLAYLYLSSTSIGERGALNIAKMLMCNSTLLGICFRYNRIGNQAGEIILKSLKYNSTVRFMYFKGSGVSEKNESRIQMIIWNNKLGKRNHRVTRSKDMLVFPKVLSKSIAKELPDELKVQIWDWCFDSILDFRTGNPKDLAYALSNPGFKDERDKVEDKQTNTNENLVAPSLSYKKRAKYYVLQRYSSILEKIGIIV